MIIEEIQVYGPNDRGSASSGRVATVKLKSPLCTSEGLVEFEAEISPAYEWLWVGVVIGPSSSAAEHYGAVHASPSRFTYYPPGELPTVPVGVAQQQTWATAKFLWALRPSDVDSIERTRRGGDLLVYWDMEGLIQFGDRVATVHGQNQIRLPSSDWHRILETWRKTHPGSTAGNVKEHPSWSQVQTHLEKSRRLLDTGETRASIEAILQAMEAYVTAPYSLKAWEEALPDVNPQKREALAELFSGYATFLNRVGHHRSRDQRDESGALAEMPLDHYEGALMVGMAPYVFAYLERLGVRKAK